MERPRPILLVAIVLVGAVAIGAVVHVVRSAMHRHELGAALEGRETLATYIAEGPELDEELQERLWSWCQEDHPLAGAWSSTNDERWYLEGEGELAPELRAEHEEARSSMERLTALLSTDRLVASSRGWLPLDMRAGVRDFEKPIRAMGWATALRAYHWFGVEAMLQDDPEAVLGTLDRLDRALEPIGTFVDLMFTIGAAGDRDRIYLRLAARRALSPQRRAAWLAEPPLSLDRLAEAYRAERFLLAQPVARDLAHGDGSLTRSAFGRRRSLWRRIRNELYLHVHGPRDAQRLLEALTKLEQHARGRAPDAVIDEIEMLEDDSGPICSQWLVNGRNMLYTMVCVRASHRASRLAVHALAMVSDEDGLPATHEGFRARLGANAGLLDAGRIDVALRYERLAPDRIRITVDPDTPVPALLTNVEPTVVTYMSRVGEPATRTPLVRRDGNVEMRVPSI